jgi:RNA methyltransferase, TrmH family
VFSVYEDYAERAQENAFVIEGATLIDEAISAGWQIESQFVAPGASPCSGAGSAVNDLAPGVIERVASTNSPQPVMAIALKREVDIADLGSAKKSDWIVVVDKISDPGNLGTILRSAEAAGASAVVLTSGTVDAFSPKVVRASAGALFNVPIYEGATIEQVADLGFALWGSSSHEMPNSSSFTATDLSGKVAIVLGNEAHGLSASTKVDGWLTIPHAGRGESLNVAMAATLLCFEVKRQHEI